MYQFKISLKYSHPLIWRRVLVPTSFTFNKLHETIQILFGWEGEHSYEFSAGKSYQSKEINDDMQLDRYFKRPRQKATYLYDFGDDWEHQIVFEKSSENERDFVYPLCIEGENSAPPEDCGGIWGYYDMLEAVKDNEHPDHEDLIDWLGDSFDPFRFEMDSVNKELKRLKAGRRKPQVIAGFPVEGEILNKGKCICAICGKKVKLGGTINPHPDRQSVLVLCEKCTVKESAKRSGTTIEEAQKNRERMFASQRLMMDTFVERYLKESGNLRLSDVNEANAVLHSGIKWWNEELSIQDRKDIEMLSLEEQKNIFLEAPIDFDSLKNATGRNSIKVGRNEPCPCGSGKKYKKCCLLSLS